MISAERMIPWQQAWQQALYGINGFYRRPEGPAGHFRTACHAGAPILAPALTRLAHQAGCTTIVDVGAGRGELLTALSQLGSEFLEDTEDLTDSPPDLFTVPAPAPLAGPTRGHGPTSGKHPEATGDTVGARTRLRLHGVDVVSRPPGLPERIGWSAGLSALPDDVLDNALVVAWELLDVIPMPVAEVDISGTVRIVLVDPTTGTERPGPPLTAMESAWCARWWPVVDADPGLRVEIGVPRDRVWMELVRKVARTPRGGLLLAVDYSHQAEHRPQAGTLAAYRGGRAVPPFPDGSCDLTAHVALDAVAVAGERAGATSSLLTHQRPALRALGVLMGPNDLATARAAGTATLLAQLEVRSQMDELLDESGFGGFGWLIHGVRHAIPDQLHRS